MNSLNEYFWFSFEWINSLNEYFRRTIEWIIEWIRKVRYSYEKWTKSAFFGRNGPLLPVFHCFLKLWFVFQFEWIILLNEYFWFNFEWIILLNEYSWFNFELNIELNHFLARFNVKMNNQNLSPTPNCEPGSGWVCLDQFLAEIEREETFGWKGKFCFPNCCIVVFYIVSAWCGLVAKVLANEWEQILNSLWLQ